MRNISVAHTKRQVRNQTKTVTRRLGWKYAQVGQLLQPIEQGQGLKPGQPVVKVGCPVRIVHVSQEWMADFPLRFSAQDECAREGFPEMTPAEFCELFRRIHPGRSLDDLLVTRIEWVYTVPLATSQMHFMQQHAGHLHRRAGEEFERERSDDPRLDWLTCGGCGEMTLVQAERWYDRELSTGEASAALSRVFEQKAAQVSR